MERKHHLGKKAGHAEQNERAIGGMSTLRNLKKEVQAQMPQVHLLSFLERKTVAINVEGGILLFQFQHD